MPEKKNSPERPASLRQRAEELAREREGQLPAGEGKLSAEATRQALHELQVHQIELEMQNEELRRAQQELEASRAKYFELYDLAPVGYVSLDEKGLIVLANLTAAGLLAVTRGELLRQPLTRFILPEDQDIFYRHQRQLEETAALQSCELRMVRRDAEPFWARLEATVCRGEDGARLCRTLMSDITARKAAEQEREAVRSRLEAVNLLQQSLLASEPLERKLERITDSVVRNFEAEFCRIWLIGPGDRCEKGCLHAAVKEGPRECRQRKSCLHLVGNSGRGAHTDGLVHHRIPLGCYRLGRLAAGEEPKFLTNDEQNDPLLQHDDWAHDPGLVSSAGYQLCVPGGEPLGVMAVLTRQSLSSVDDAVLEGLSHTAALIVQKAAAEGAHEKLVEQLGSARKMEAVVRLAGGVAHDFNNILTVILGSTGFALEAIHEGEPLWEDLRDIQRAGERAAVLTHQLLAFSRKQLLQPKPLDLNQLVPLLERTLQRILGEDIGLTCELAPELGSTMADPSQFQQALMNLALNARDAMPEGGKLTLQTANVDLDERFAANHPGSKPGPYVRLSVSDSGCGMDARTRDRIFEPFFTTKEHGKGAGLGLSTVQGIIGQSGGFIRVASEPGQGTRFDLFLPRILSVQAPVSRAGQTAASPGGAETILVVEDEDGLRALVTRILRKAGYTVLTAANGVEALQLCEAREVPPDLVLSDVVMPRMGGHRLAERLAATHPKLKLLFMSGYADDEAARYGVLDRGAPFLAKPFAADDLIRKVREVLDSSAKDS